MDRPLFHALLALLVATAGLAVATVFRRAGEPPPDVVELPRTLEGTGLYEDGPGRRVRPTNRLFEPRHPLWSDGARKRRWIFLPPGTAIDGSMADAWRFPVGTRFWKEFSHQGRPVETRYLERLADGSWRYASYVWTEDGRDAVLAPAEGLGLVRPRLPGGRYQVPSEADCHACHEGTGDPVLGFGALQLSRQGLPPREPGETDGLDLRELVDEGLLAGFPAALVDHRPGGAANSPLESAALGYLHANCGHCHRGDEAGVPVRLSLTQSVLPRGGRDPEWRRAIGAPSRFRAAQAPGVDRLIAPGAADASVLVLRMRSRDPQVQMPPLGTFVVDESGVSLIEQWINSMPRTTENTP